jgi:hypothetical protein
VRWVASEFEAVLDFYNHTSLGLKYLELRLIDREANAPFGTYANKIADATLAARDRLLQHEHGADSDHYAKVKVLCGSALSENYHIDNLEYFQLTHHMGMVLFSVQNTERLRLSLYTR